MAIDAALAPGGWLDPAVEHGEKAVQVWLDAGAPVASAVRRHKISLRSPDPDDLTLREARLLATADRVYHRDNVPSAILDRARADAVRISCNRAPTEVEPGLSLDLGWAD